MQKVGRQELELIKMGVDPENIYKEYVRGVSTNKGELNKLLGVAKEGDVIAVTEASRISRSAE
jgi:DNA invertase Pin-like site-specific DNA recombinase